MMRWAVRIIACYPEVQNKVRVELDDVCGRGVEITWDKRKQLPYTMAVMKSVHTVALLDITLSHPHQSLSHILHLLTGRFSALRTLHQQV